MKRWCEILAVVLILSDAVGAPCVAASAVEASSSAASAATPSRPDETEAKPGLTSKAFEAAKSVASKAGDILSRIPCLPPTGAVSVSLPRVARKLSNGEPVTIIAFGSSSTAGYGSSSAAYTYPSRLAEQLRRQYPRSNISIINRGMGGQEVPEMMARLQSSVLDSHPDLVIWQLGTNLVVRGQDTAGTAAMVEDGVARMQAQGADVVLIDPQYVPAVTAQKEGANRMVKLIKDVARLRHASVFPRFEVMREWHENEKLPFDSFVIGDGLHLNDWGYACFAQLLGDTIIKSVSEAKTGIDTPATVISLRPM
jgi:lysophospholipase L1-like esterase